MKESTVRSRMLFLMLVLPAAWLSGMVSAYACNVYLFCTLDYSPVCGTDGKTYSNSCMADRVCVDVAYPGVCNQPPPQCQDLDNDLFSPNGGDCGPIDCNDQDPTINPDMACIEIYEPVCGVDGITYPNSCEALRACVTIDHPGECGQPPVCIDNDQDGYSPNGGDCGPVDCNDNDPGINPGTICTTEITPVCGVDGTTYNNACEAARVCMEIAHEGACQEVIPTVTTAHYNRKWQRLIVIASSELGQEDQLTVEGFGDMMWIDRLQVWILIAGGLAADQIPATITVNGRYGSATADVTMRLNGQVRGRMK